MYAMTEEIAAVWLAFLASKLMGASTINEIKEAKEKLIQEAELAKDHGFVFKSIAVSRLCEEADKTLAILERAKVFKGEEPHLCTHTHQRTGTGVFYNSLGILQCLECKGWQSIRSVIR